MALGVHYYTINWQGSMAANSTKRYIDEPYHMTLVFFFRAPSSSSSLHSIRMTLLAERRVHMSKG